MTRRKHSKVTIKSLKSQQVKTKKTYKLILNLEKKKDEMEQQQNILKIKKFCKDSIFDTQYENFYEEKDFIQLFDNWFTTNKLYLLLSRLKILQEHCDTNNNLFNILNKIKYIKNNDNFHHWFFQAGYNYLMDYYKEAQYIEPFCLYLQNEYDPKIFIDEQVVLRVCKKLINSSKEIKKNITGYLHKNYGFLLFKTNTDCYQKILEYILPCYVNKNNKINLTQDKKIQLPKINISAYYKSEYKEEYVGKQEYFSIPIC